MKSTKLFSPDFIYLYSTFRFYWDVFIFLMLYASVLGIFFYPIKSWYVLLTVIVTLTQMIFTTLGLHRYFSHKSFKTSRFFQALLGLGCCLSLQRDPIWWAATHREHHKFSGQEKDPHSREFHGFWYAHIGWLFQKRTYQTHWKNVPDLMRFPELMWMHHFFMVLGLLFGMCLYFLGGVALVLWGLILPTILSHLAAHSVNSFGHTYGSQPNDTGDGSSNSHILAWLTLGDGWHNNHHFQPRSARHGFKWYEFDLTYILIRLLEFLGIVWDVKQPRQR